MRSIPLLAATTVILFGVGACGDDNGGTGNNEDPVAGFTAAQPCTVGVACAFTDASSDPQGANTITTRSWDFNGDGTEDLGGNQTAPTFTYTAEGVFQAKLTVTDNSGNTDDVIVPVTVNPATSGTAPTASFTLPPSCTAGTPCGFTSTSTDDGSIVAALWEFGDGQTAIDLVNATHTFTTANTYNVKLTVTDDQGLTGTVTQPLIVTAPSSQDCTTSSNQSGGRIVNCTLSITQRSNVALTITSRSCELGGNSLSITAPRSYVIFANLCFAGTVGQPVTVNDINGAPIVFEAGSTLGLRFNQGTADAGDPPTGDPGIEIDGSGPWTLNIDDGGAAGTAGEPDFNDAVITVTATAAP